MENLQDWRIMGYLQRKHTKDRKYEINRLGMEMRDVSAAYEQKNADKPDKHNFLF